MTTPVTPVAGPASIVPVGGTAVVAIDANVNGGFITNPSTATEYLFVDPTGADATLTASGTTFGLAPGVTWTAIPGQTTTTSVNAQTDGHAFTSVQF